MTRWCWPNGFAQPTLLPLMPPTIVRRCQKPFLNPCFQTSDFISSDQLILAHQRPQLLLALLFSTICCGAAKSLRLMETGQERKIGNTNHPPRRRFTWSAPLAPLLPATSGSSPSLLHLLLLVLLMHLVIRVILVLYHINPLYGALSGWSVRVDCHQSWTKFLAGSGSLMACSKDCPQNGACGGRSLGW